MWQPELRTASPLSGRSGNTAAIVADFRGGAVPARMG